MDDFIWAIALFIALPWLVLHYVTKWKTSATITTDDEALLEDLYSLSKRLDERMHTVERLVAQDNPDFRQSRLRDDRNFEAQPLRELEELLAKDQGDRR